MAGTPQDAMQCNEFEALLADVLDGELGGTRLERFRAHRQLCALCGAMFAEAEAGKGWLHGLQEAEPPRHLVHNILAATSGVAPARITAEQGSNWAKSLRDWAAPVLSPVLQPRFAMSFAMAFFSVSIMLNLAGVRLNDIRHADLRPGAVRDNTVRTYYETTARVVKYYDNLRLVYEIESRVRELKNAAEPVEEPQPAKQEKEKKPNQKTSGEPERQKDDQHYSLSFVDPSWAVIAAPRF